MLSEITRKEIMDILEEGFTSQNFLYFGSLDEVRFFNRLYKLGELPSTDTRFSHADRDLNKHLIVNDDWDWDWFYVFYNDNFDLVANDSKFLAFLAEIFHPSVRGILNTSAKEYLKKINYLLRFDGYELLPSKSISGRAIYEWREIRGDSALLKNIESLKINFNSAYIDDQIDIMVNMADQHPNLAIGKAKELLESCAKTILNELEIEFDSKMDLNSLVKKTYKSLKIDSSSIDKDNKYHQTSVKILGSLSAITQFMAELRNEYGDGHGKDREFRNLPPHYAHLAIGTATTVVRFMWDTHNIMKNSSKTI